MENITSFEDFNHERISEAKYKDKEDAMSGRSILVKRSLGDEFSPADGKRRSSIKANIHWEEGVLETRSKSKLHALGLMVARGSKWSYVQDIITKIKTEEAKVYKGEESYKGQGLVSSKGFDTYIRNEWFNMAKVHSDKEADLTLDQQTQLEILKLKCKKENDRYLKRHPELGILLSLVYRKLFKLLPEDPTQFVANYVHYLNLQRQELVLEEKEVPFDKQLTLKSEESISESKERIETTKLARDLLDKCVDIASRGEAFVNVKNIMDSVLLKISPSEDDIGTRESMRSAEKAIGSIISSLLTTAVLTNMPSSEIVVDNILDIVIQNVCPTVEEDSNIFVEIRESIEALVQSLLKEVTDRVDLRILEKETDRLNENLDTASIRSKGILRLNSAKEHAVKKKDSREKVLVRTESKVKFQSLQ